MSDDQFATCEAEMARRNPYGVPPDAKTGALFELGHTAQESAWADAQAYPEDHESICWLQ